MTTCAPHSILTAVVSAAVALALTGCGPIIDESATAILTWPGDGGGNVPTVNFGESESESEPESGGSGSNPTDSGPDDPTMAPDLPPPDACGITTEWCDAFLPACWLDFNSTICEPVEAMDCYAPAEPTTICEYCADLHAKCLQEPSMTADKCTIGEQKCLASALLDGCECQPAYFACSPSQTYCPGESYEWQYQDGGYCAPYCKSQDDCGDPLYATCESGWCQPHVLIFCW